MAAVFTNQYYRDQQRWPVATEREREIFNDTNDILESYHYIHSPRLVKQIRDVEFKVFLDSGAFSMWTKGVKIPVKQYCDYVLANKDIIRVEDGALMASVLDGIGDPLQTYRNQLEMEYWGVTPLPCFHFGEDERYLEYYISRYPYITIGGMVGKSTDQLLVWLDRVWNRYMVDGTGRPRAKFHGFGITSVPVMERYPWHSVDSSSWIQSAGFGSIMHPTIGPLPISDKSPSRHDAGRHVLTMSAAHQNYLATEFEKAGFTTDILVTRYESRVAYNVWSFGEVCRRINMKGEYVPGGQIELFS